HENIKRVPLHHIDQGDTFVMMREKLHMTEMDIAATVGKSVAYVSQHISLVSQDPNIVMAVRDNSISFSQARSLLTVTNKSQRNHFLFLCQNSGATIETLEGWIKDWKNSLILNPPPAASEESVSYPQDRPYDFRLCQACGKATEITRIRQVFYCPECDLALKKAISEENLKNISNNSPPDAQELP
ncbi:unnamed protein product, partial [marine sediment metagenome]